MKILVDTPIWSLSIRKKEKSENDLKLVSYFSDLLRGLNVILIGPIRQEILSGISDENRFEVVRKSLSVIPDMDLTTMDYELAAEYHNRCRKNGIQGSHTDFLICAIASNRNCRILTLDNDFRIYSKHINLNLVDEEEYINN